MCGWSTQEVIGEGLVVHTEVVEIDLEPVLTETRVATQLLAVQKPAARLPRVALDKVLVAAPGPARSSFARTSDITLLCVRQSSWVFSFPLSVG